ncbi:hypothetical protein F183_A50460 [Bryobacterales bacterium F-183]|nr:hypothetical protein F183_A50460 [Bryobacterales bacterium F-183]
MKFLRKLWRRRALEQEMQDELAFHREMAAANGHEARLGNETLIREEGYEMWRFTFVENLWRDLKHAGRSLLASPGFAASALLSLALGIGANATLFSLTMEFLFSEPSVRDAASVVYIRLGGSSHQPEAPLQFLENSGLFESVTGEREEAFLNWNDGRETRRVFALFARSNYFTALGIPVAMGRPWTPADPRESAVVRWQFWRKQLNADPNVIGSTMILNGKAYQVVGVLPESHRTITGFGFSPDVYVPAFLPENMFAIRARLKPDMTLGQARAALPAIVSRMDKELPNPGFKYSENVSVKPIAGLARLKQDDGVLATVKVFFSVLLAMAALVLIVACVNVAGLLLARASARKQEIAIRISLGAGKGRLLQQLLCESILLAALGAAAGFLGALSVARTLASISLPFPLPIELHVEPDWRVVAYAVLMAVVAILVAGLLPAWQALRESLNGDMHRERRLRLRRTLVGAQIALSFLLLATGFLFLHNLTKSTGMSPGFDTHKTLRAEVYLPPGPYENKDRVATYRDQALSQLRAIPGVEAAAYAVILPFMDHTTHGGSITLAHNQEKVRVHYGWNSVSPDYFRAMDIPIVAGRDFRESDRPGQPRVVIVNTVFAQRYLKGREAVGTVFRWRDSQDLLEVAGVVKPVKMMTIGEEEEPQLYVPAAQESEFHTRFRFVLRSATTPVGQLTQVREVLRKIDATAAMEVDTMYSSIGLAFLPSQVGGALMGGIGILGLVLAMIGLYGLMAFNVARRTREIGVRLAIGAGSGEILRMVLREAAMLLVVGGGIGLVLALVVTRPLTMFFVPGLSASDPLTYLAVAALLGLTGLAAALGPARRAVRVDPVQALRWE